ncbi:MAG: SPOR domain-containing protein [Bacteroidales bacterium]|nr:MAG: SPOR domain-containing protein [Bacteroidales bacterium]
MWLNISVNDRVKYLFYLITVLFFNLNTTKGQEQINIFNRLNQDKYNQGEVEIIQDSSIVFFMYHQLKSYGKLNGIRGYRISIFRDTGQDAREKCMAERSRFKSRYENIPLHEEFVYPYYKLYAGDFRTESEALKFLKIIERDFPNAFIVRDIISYPKLN